MRRKSAPELLKSAHTCSETLGLTLSQERAITALFACRSVAAAAKQAKVGQSTLRRWLREDQKFQTKLRRLREDALGHASLRLQQSASLAVETLYDLLACKDTIEPGRASLVRAAIDFAFRSGSYSDLAERIAALERAPPPKESLPEGNQMGQDDGSGENTDPWKQGEDASPTDSEPRAPESE